MQITINFHFGNKIKSKCISYKKKLVLFGTIHRRRQKSKVFFHFNSNEYMNEETIIMWPKKETKPAKLKPSE